MKDPWQMLGAIVLVALAVVLGYAIMNKTHTDNPQPHHPQPRPLEPHRARHQFVFVSSKSCAWCDKMERTTFAHPKVAETMAERYTYAKVSGKDAAKRYNVTALPTYIILDSEGREVRRGSGYRSPEEFLAWLDQQRPNTTGDTSPVEDEP